MFEMLRSTDEETPAIDAEQARQRQAVIDADVAAFKAKGGKIQRVGKISRDVATGRPVWCINWNCQEHIDRAVRMNRQRRGK